MCQTTFEFATRLRNALNVLKLGKVRIEDFEVIFSPPPS